MIDYQTYCQIRHLLTEKKLGLRQIARELKLGLNTVRKWARQQTFKPAATPQRPSKLDPFKGDIVRLLEQHAYSAQQIFQQLKERGFQGRYTIIKDFVRQVRPKPRPAFLTLHFAPGECAQVDWGCAGSLPVGSTQRRRRRRTELLLRRLADAALEDGYARSFGQPPATDTSRADCV